MGKWEIPVTSFAHHLCEFNIEFMIVKFKLMNEARYYADIINE